MCRSLTPNQKTLGQPLKLLDDNVGLPRMNWKAMPQFQAYSCITVVSRVSVGPADKYEISNVRGEAGIGQTPCLSKHFLVIIDIATEIHLWLVSWSVGQAVGRSIAWLRGHLWPWLHCVR